MTDTPPPAGQRLNRLLAKAGLGPLDPALADRFQVYLSLLLHWNSRLNLTAVRDEDGILARHFVESIACARALPAGVTTLLDFGSGAGFPGIPVALCRPEISVTLVESQGKKAAFLQEAVRTLHMQAAVYAQRAESLTSQFDCVTLRAVDRMQRAVRSAARLVAPGGWLILMTTRTELSGLQEPAGLSFAWSEPLPLPFGEERILALGRLSETSV